MHWDWQSFLEWKDIHNRIHVLFYASYRPDFLLFFHFICYMVVVPLARSPAYVIVRSFATLSTRISYHEVATHAVWVIKINKYIPTVHIYEPTSIAYSEWYLLFRSRAPYVLRLSFDGRLWSALQRAQCIPLCDKFLFWKNLFFSFKSVDVEMIYMLLAEMCDLFR